MKKLACYGWAHSGGASLVGSNYLVLEQLLELGYEIDFYGNPRHVPPSGIPKNGTIRYCSATVREHVPSMLGTRSAKVLGLILSHWMQPKWARAYAVAIAEAGGPEQYKLLLTMGCPPGFVIPGTPTLSWLQGAPGSELEAIQRIKSYFRRLGISGITTYAGLELYYRLSDLRDRHDLDECTNLITGSEWSRRRLKTTFSGSVDALPYAIDIEKFRSKHPTSSASRVLWLGRLDPRKRFDLFVDSAPLIHKVFPDVTFTIVGSAAYAKSQLRLLQTLGSRYNVQHIPHLDRNSIPDLLAETLVLVQPSMYENFGTSVAEAATSGVPAVVGPSNGTADYVRNSATVFGEYTRDSVANAVIRSIRSRRDDFAAVTEATRAEAEISFSPRRIALRLAEIIENTSIS